MAVLAKLNTIQERVVVTEDQLETVHTQKFHLLLVDSTLTDYQHIHPQPTQTPGVYSFTFTPKLPGGYRAWADITPTGGKQQFAMSEDLGAHRAGAINKVESHEATIDGYHFMLSFDKPPVTGGESMGTIMVIDKKSNPVMTLEPVMGAFAHIAGFYDDFRTVVHTHPMGKEPDNAHDRGGPELQFHFMPSKTGFVKLFAQVQNCRQGNDGAVWGSGGESALNSLAQRFQPFQLTLIKRIVEIVQYPAVIFVEPLFFRCGEHRSIHQPRIDGNAGDGFKGQIFLLWNTATRFSIRIPYSPVL